MDVRITAITEKMHWIAKGETRVYTGIKTIIDKGSYYNLVRSENWKIRVSKDNWKLEVL